MARNSGTLYLESTASARRRSASLRSGHDQLLQGKRERLVKITLNISRINGKSRINSRNRNSSHDEISNVVKERMYDQLHTREEMLRSSHMSTDNCGLDRFSNICAAFGCNERATLHSGELH